jgi:hypothetical protein
MIARRLVRRGWGLPGVALLVLVSGCGAPAGADLSAEPVDRVLVVSLPGVAWADVEDAGLPHLEDFLQHAAIGDISTRIRLDDASSTDAYLTLGAGTRALAPLIDTAVAVDPDESYRGVSSAEILERRLGHVPNGIAYLAMGGARLINDESDFGADVGILGDALADAGVDRAVIANADASEGFVSGDPPPDGAYSRGAATMLVDFDGIVPEGAVGRSLLADDSAAPFGMRLDHGQVLAEFDEVWQADEADGTQSVVLVEASDLSRTVAYRPRATQAQQDALWGKALAEADALLGDLLERVDADRDAVIVLSPVSSAASPGLGMAAASAPGIEPGLLRSATTRRDGYVQLADVAPTVLSLLGADLPDSIEGRPFEVGHRPGGDRVDRLADAAEAAGFRDTALPWFITGISVALTALAAATWLRRRLGPRLRFLLVVLGIGTLVMVPATFLAGQIAAVRTDPVGYAAAVTAIAAPVVAGAVWLERRRPGLGALVGVGTIVGLIAVDVVVGAPLQVNALFGYSVAIAGRFVGIGNFAFALFGAATIVLAALIVDRAGRRGLGIAVALFGFVILLEGLPMWGADVGGTISMVPAFGVTALLLAGRRVGWREVGALIAAAGIALVAFAVVDATRPSGAQTHLVRFGEDLLAGRWNEVFTTLGRRWQASFGDPTVTGWVTIGMLVLVASAYATLVATGHVGPGTRMRERHQPTVAAAAGLAVLGTLGVVANDSSFTVPVTMLIVVVPALVLRKMSQEPRRVRVSSAAGDGGRL